MYDSDYDPKTVNGMVPQPPPARMDFTTFDSPLDFNASGMSFEDQDGRFVAGEQFYNHEMYGSLRKGGAVDFLSMECLGLVAATFTSMLSYQALLVLVQPMYNTQLGLSSSEIVAVERLIQMPMALSFVVGLLSDCYPIMGLRRKGYMILGCIINAVAVFAIAGVSAYLGSDSTASNGIVVLALVLVALASIGCIITYVCVHTRVIEYSQRESLRVLPDLPSLRVDLHVGAVVPGPGNRSEPNISVSTAMIVLGIISILPLPLVFRYWNEEVYSLNTSMKIRSQILWKIMQQKAVWRILAFIWFFTLFLGIKFRDSNSVISQWAGASGDNSLLVKTIQDFVMIGIMLLWRYLFLTVCGRSSSHPAQPFRVAYGGARYGTRPLLLPCLLLANIRGGRYWPLEHHRPRHGNCAGGIGGCARGSHTDTAALCQYLRRHQRLWCFPGLQLLQRERSGCGQFRRALGCAIVAVPQLRTQRLGVGRALLPAFTETRCPAAAHVRRLHQGCQWRDPRRLSRVFIYSLVVTLMSLVPSTSCLTLLPTAPKTEEVLVVDLTGRLCRSTIKATPSMELKMDFKHLQSPSFDLREADGLPLQTISAIRDAEASVLETGAGQPLYNSEIYGGLRKGGAVKFFSRYCVGLVAATFSSTFAVECLNSTVQPMLKQHFGLTPAQLAASQRLTSMPLILSFLFGLLSDCYPIMGLRRKAYTLLGLVTSVTSIWFLAGLNAYAESFASGTAGTGLAVLVIAFAAFASMGNIIMYVGIHTRVIELSQREPLGLRGSILATYLIFRCVVYIITDACVYAYVVPPDDGIDRLRLYHRTAGSLDLQVLGREALLAVTTVKTRGQILWKIMQQKAVWSVLAFQCFFTLFNQISFSGPSLIISVWAGASGDNPFVQQLMYYGATIVTMLVWRYYFMNRPWRSFYAACPLLLIVPQLIVSILVSQDILRDRLFYRLMTLFSSVSFAIGWLSSVVPLTEIIQEGSEGAMVGLTLSLYFLVDIFVQTNSVGLFEGSNFYDVAAVAADTTGARGDVLKALILNYGINALSMFGLFFLPRQKLDTQQLRSYGGYTKCASAAIVTFAVILFLYSFSISIMTFVPGTACIRINGGAGC
ncbi:Major facilitator superfamily domain [Phytophthora cactorum]|nr:Major facilitator superfamily domain [Phytophthora cactorum]